MGTGARTYVVPAAGHPTVDDWVTEGAYAAGWGMDIHGSLPPYLGVWLAPNGGEYHLFSDYPAAMHERFGFSRTDRASETGGAA